MARPWYAFYPADYERDTAHLTLAQHGAYRRLLDHYYSTGKPLPANAGILHRVCRAFDDAERASVNHVVATYFKLEDDGYHSHRVDRELVKACEISEKRQAAANSRYAKAPANAHAIAVQKHTQSQPQSQTTEETITTTTSVVAVVSFEDFFKEMPRKVNKHLARQAYSKAILRADPAHILEAAKHYSKTTAGFEERYILSAAKWLDDDRWTDFASVKKSAFDSPEEQAFQKKMMEKHYGNA